MSAATGISEDLIRRIHMIGQLTKGSCSMAGIWGDALQDKDGLLTVRALDWDMGKCVLVVLFFWYFLVVVIVIVIVTMIAAIAAVPL